MFKDIRKLLKEDSVKQFNDAKSKNRELQQNDKEKIKNKQNG